MSPMKMIYCNTTSNNPTHFLAGAELVNAGRKKFNIASENWPYPTKYRFGMPSDNYYCEIWVDGMDWQHTYWIIETINFEYPKIYPLIIFDNHEEENEFNSYDFGELIEATMYYRRDKFWIKHNDYGRFFDTIWPYINAEESFLFDGFHKQIPNMKKFYILHSSQKRVNFWINIDFIPLNIGGR